jgi:3',5'-cyclic AMP phosphodiesterase CpdA
VASAIVADHDDAEFVLFVGDLPWNDKPGLWWTFFDRGRELFARKPLVAVPGNHDTPTVNSNTDTSRLRSWFGLASPSDTSRALRWGPAGLLLLDSERPDDFLLTTGAQYQLAAQTIQAWGSDPPTWSFAAFHVPPYNAGARHAADQGTFRDVTGLFDGAIDWVLGGHEHLAQRTKPMRYNGQLAGSGSYGRGPTDGVGYLVLPPAGAWPETGLIAWDDPKAYYRDRLAFPVPVAQQNTIESEIGYAIVRLAGSAITLEVWGMGDYASAHAPVLRDSVSYTRP